MRCFLGGKLALVFFVRLFWGETKWRVHLLEACIFATNVAGCVDGSKQEAAKGMLLLNLGFKIGCHFSRRWIGNPKRSLDAFCCSLL